MGRSAGDVVVCWPQGPCQLSLMLPVLPQGFLPGLLLATGDCCDAGRESRKAILSSHCQHFHCWLRWRGKETAAGWGQGQTFVSALWLSHFPGLGMSGTWRNRPGAHGSWWWRENSWEWMLWGQGRHRELGSTQKNKTFSTKEYCQTSDVQPESRVTNALHVPALCFSQ